LQERETNYTYELARRGESREGGGEGGKTRGSKRLENVTPERGGIERGFQIVLPKNRPPEEEVGGGGETKFGEEAGDEEPGSESP